MTDLPDDVYLRLEQGPFWLSDDERRILALVANLGNMAAETLEAREAMSGDWAQAAMDIDEYGRGIGIIGASNSVSNMTNVISNIIPLIP